MPYGERVRALLVANGHDADPGLVGEDLRRRGVALELCPREDPGRWPGIDGVGLLVLLGSDWSVYWPEVRASVEAEAELVREAHRSGVPVLAICFGAQLVAHALGGQVGPAPTAEVGWCEIEPMDGRIERGPWLQWHVDGFEPPPGFEVLARSDSGVQAVRGGHTLAVQFHPEVTPSIIDRWSNGAGEEELAGHGVDAALLRAETRALLDGASERCGRLMDWFWQEVTGR